MVERSDFPAGGLGHRRVPGPPGEPPAAGRTRALWPTGQKTRTHARLWQDPLTPAANAAAEAATEWKKEAGARPGQAAGTAGCATGAQEVFEHLGVQANDCVNEILILPVLVTASPYEEGSETRRRLRYAVLSALALAEFEPLDSEHLSYFFFQCHRADSRPTKPCGVHGEPEASPLLALSSRVIPYEWFKGTKSERKYVLALWVSDDVLGDHPLRQVAALVQELKSADQAHRKKICGAGTAERPKTTGGSSDDQLKTFIRVLGPPNSDMMNDMLPDMGAEDLALNDQKPEEMFSNVPCLFVMYSSQATLSKPKLSNVSNRDLVVQFPEEDPVQCQCKMRLILTIGTDEWLADTLCKELRRRDVGVGGSRDQVALLTEWDTDYAREMVQIFKEGLSRLRVDVRLYYYLRGLDGRILENKPTNQKPASPSDSARASLKPAMPSVEETHGQSQVDYLRRLVDQLQREEGAVKAIGLLGTDIYDKILLLRAVRPVAPHVLFFTTDLDAGLFDPAEYQSTRNLLIASHYGLQLDPHLAADGRVPPFRSSYQTSLCRGCLRALADVRFFESGSGGSLADMPPPALYEIGRSGPYLLSAQNPRTDGAPPPTDIVRWFETHWGWTAVAAVLALALLAALKPELMLVPIQRLPGLRGRAGGHALKAKANSDASGPLSLWWIWATGAALFLGMFAVVVADRHWPGYEPFVLFEGISTWPTEFIRLFACLLAVYATFKILCASDSNARKITRDFALDHEHPAHRPPEPQVPRSAGWLGADRLSKWAQSEGEAEGGNLWDDYRRDGAFADRVRRTLPIMAIYWLISITLIVMLGLPARPVRGLLNSWVDRLMLTASVVATIWLLFFVFDATRLCGRLVRVLHVREICWPEALRRKEALRQGIAESAKDSAALEHLINVQLVEARTETVGQFIYYPFVMILIMFLSRYHIFDNWCWSMALILGYLITVAMVIYCAFLMRRSAEHMRADALEALRNHLDEVRGRGPTPGEATVDQIQAMIKEVENANQGAFCKLADNPIIRAVLIPFGGVGSLALLDQLRAYL